MKKKIESARNIILLSVFIHSFSGCYQKFYEKGTRNSIDKGLTEQLTDSQKYFIVHLPEGIIGISNVIASQDSIFGDEIQLSKPHSKELNPKQVKPNVVKNKYKDYVLTEVHLYATNCSKMNRLAIAFKDINRADIYEFDEKLSKSSNFISTIGVIVVSLVGLASLEKDSILF
jgi:hypothetical protein